MVKIPVSYTHLDVYKRQVLILKDIDETKAKNLIESLPLYQLKKNVEYLNLTKQF